MKVFTSETVLSAFDPEHDDSIDGPLPPITHEAYVQRVDGQPLAVEVLDLGADVRVSFFHIEPGQREGHRRHFEVTADEWRALVAAVTSGKVAP